MRSALPNAKVIAYSFSWRLERAEKEIRFSMANGIFKTKMDIDRHGPRLVPNNCKN